MFKKNIETKLKIQTKPSVKVSNKEEIARYLDKIIKNENYDDLVTVFEIGKDPNNSDFEKTILDSLKKKGYFHLFKYNFILLIF